MNIKSSSKPSGNMEITLVLTLDVDELEAIDEKNQGLIQYALRDAIFAAIRSEYLTQKNGY